MHKGGSAALRILFLLCLVSSACCIAAGYIMIGSWLGAALMVVPCVPALLFRRIPAAWAPAVFLAGSTGIAAAGLLAGAPALMMIAGAAFALGAWDLANLELSLSDGGKAHASAVDFPTHHVWRHVSLLGLSLGAGLIAASAALAIPLRLPFLVMLPLVLLDFFCLERLARYLSSREKEPVDEVEAGRRGQ